MGVKTFADHDRGRVTADSVADHLLPDLGLPRHLSVSAVRKALGHSLGLAGARRGPFLGFPAVWPSAMLKDQA